MKTQWFNLANRFRCSPGLGVFVLVVSAGCADVSYLEEGSEGYEDVQVQQQALSTSGNSHVVWRVTSNFLSRDLLIDVLTYLDQNDEDIDAMATAPNGAWTVVSGTARWYSGNFPLEPRAAIGGFLSAGKRLIAIDFNESGGWVVVAEDDEAYGGPIPVGLADKIAQYRTNGWQIQDVDITDNGYVVVGSGNLVSWTASLDNTLESVLSDRIASKRKVRQVDIGFDGRWMVAADQESATEGVSTQLTDRLRAMAESRRFISRFMFGLGNNYVVYSHGLAAPGPASPIEAIEYDVGGQTIWEAMNGANIPGLSIALIKDNAVSYARGYGRLNAAEQTPVIAKTPFDLASLSKYLGALTTLKLADQGEVSIGQDILNAPGPSVANWKWLGENPAVAAAYGMPATPLPPGVTLGRLMQHRAGIKDQGESPSAHPNHWALFENSSQTLAGLFGYVCWSSGACSYPGTEWTWTTSVPGGAGDYASRNYLLVQAVDEDATGKRAVELLEDLITTPLGLSNTSGRVPLASGFEARAAWPHNSAGTPRSVRSLYPHTFAGGIFASASDYARMLILALNQGKDEDGVQRISSGRINQMLNGVETNAGFGLFFEGGKDALEGSDRAFRHTGSHSAGARTRMCGSPTRDEGIVILTNAAKTTAVDVVLDAIFEKFARVMNWPGALDCR